MNRSTAKTEKAMIFAAQTRGVILTAHAALMLHVSVPSYGGQELPCLLEVHNEAKRSRLRENGR
jgi:hypothetical protein